MWQGRVVVVLTRSSWLINCAPAIVLPYRLVPLWRFGYSPDDPMNARDWRWWPWERFYSSLLFIVDQTASNQTVLLSSESAAPYWSGLQTLLVGNYPSVDAWGIGWLGMPAVAVQSGAHVTPDGAVCPSGGGRCCVLLLALAVVRVCHAASASLFFLLAFSPGALLSTPNLFAPDPCAVSAMPPIVIVASFHLAALVQRL